jgi:hypothetical protein
MVKLKYVINKGKQILNYLTKILNKIQTKKYLL